MRTVNQRPGKDPMLKMDFTVEIEGMADLGFMEVDDVSIKLGEATYREGNGPNYPHKQPTMQTVDNITLKRGLFKDETALLDWFNADGADRRVVDIVRLTHTRSGNRRNHLYRLYEAYPAELKLPGGDSTADSDNAIVEMVIAFEDVDTLMET